MTYEEIKKKHLVSSFTRYPVLNKRKEIIGVFNIKNFYRGLIKEKAPIWSNYIEKKVIYVPPQRKLDKILAKMKSADCYLLFVKEGGKMVGIVTFEDVINALFQKNDKWRGGNLLPSRLD